jgi:ATP-dependent Lon protease
VSEPFPMFPLGSVLFPHAVLPLHVFEPRYRALVDHCLAGDHEFGVVLIERGSEVGGGDVRFAIGTVARIVQAGRLDDGRWVLVTVGMQRLRVERWLPDDPYPLADVERLGDEGTGNVDPQRVRDVATLLRRVHALRAELGALGGAVDVDLADDPLRASYEAASLAPLGPLDAQRLLELDDAATRLERLETLLDEEATLLELQLSSGT